MSNSVYNLGDKIATRVAYGNALAEFGCDERIIVLDADLSKSTKTDSFKSIPRKICELWYSRGKYDVGCGRNVNVRKHCFCKLVCDVCGRQSI